MVDEAKQVNESTRLHVNVVYIKMFKSASSTTGGVVRRIGAHHGLSGYRESDWIRREPGLWASHGGHGGLKSAESVYNERRIAALRLPTFRFTTNLFRARSKKDSANDQKKCPDGTK